MFWVKYAWDMRLVENNFEMYQYHTIRSVGVKWLY